jgi:hypothetical protein
MLARNYDSPSQHLLIEDDIRKHSPSIGVVKGSNKRRLVELRRRASCERLAESSALENLLKCPCARKENNESKQKKSPIFILKKELTWRLVSGLKDSREIATAKEMRWSRLTT